MSVDGAKGDGVCATARKTGLSGWRTPIGVGPREQGRSTDLEETGTLSSVTLYISTAHRTVQASRSGGGRCESKGNRRGEWPSVVERKSWARWICRERRRLTLEKDIVCD